MITGRLKECKFGKMRVGLLCAFLLLVPSLVTMNVRIAFGALPSPVYHTTYSDLVADWYLLQSDYPSFVSNETYGTAAKGTSLIAYRIGNPSGGRIMFDASCHGEETVASEVLLLYAQWLLTSGTAIANRILRNCYTIIVPSANPESFCVRRKNPNGVDLNRNFAFWWNSSGSSDSSSWEYRGPSPESENEVIAAKALWLEWHPRHYINLHTGSLPSYPRHIWWAYGMNSSDAAHAEALMEEYNNTARQQGQPVWPYTVDGKQGNYPNNAYQYTGSVGWSVEMIDEWPYTSSASSFHTYLHWWLPFFQVLSLDSETIFQSDFENSFNDWSGTRSATGVKLTLNDTRAYNGLYSCALSSTTAKNVEANPYRSFSTTYKTMYVGSYVYYPAASLALFNSSSKTASINGFFSTSGSQNWIGIAKVGYLKGIRWNIDYRNAGRWYQAFAASAPSADRWHWVVLKITTGTGTGEERMYVDGTEVVKVTGIDNGDRGDLKGAFVHGMINGLPGFIAYMDDAFVSPLDISKRPPLPAPPNIRVTSPRSVTYSDSSIPVSFSSSSDGALDEQWYNVKNSSSWVFPTNQTYSSPTIASGFIDGSYVFYAFANDTDGQESSARMGFTVNTLNQTSEGFSDGFEDGYADWTGTYLATGVTLTPSSSFAHMGLNCSKRTVQTNKYVEGNPFMNFNMTYQTLYIGCYVFYPAISLALLNNSQKTVSISGFCSATDSQTWIGLTRIRFTNDKCVWGIDYQNEGVWKQAFSNVGPRSDTWYWVVLRVTTGSGTGSQQMYVNGVCVARVDGIDNDDRGDLKGVFIHGLSYNAAGFIDYVDDVVVSTQDITNSPS